MNRDVVDQLAPGGEIRVAINLGNAALAHVDADGLLGGRSVDLARAIAAELGLSLRLDRYESAGSVVAAADGEAWDLAFLAIDPKRAARLHFSRPYTVLEATYVVIADSDMRSCADVDRPGRRIASCDGAAYDLHLRRTLQAGSLIACETPAASRALFLGDGADCVAGVRGALAEFASAHAGLRILPDDFSHVEQAIVTPRERPAAADFLDRFVAAL